MRAIFKAAQGRSSCTHSSLILTEFNLLVLSGECGNEPRVFFLKEPKGMVNRGHSLIPCHTPQSKKVLRNLRFRPGRFPTYGTWSARWGTRSMRLPLTRSSGEAKGSQHMGWPGWLKLLAQAAYIPKGDAVIRTPSG